MDVEPVSGTMAAQRLQREHGDDGEPPAKRGGEVTTPTLEEDPSDGMVDAVFGHDEVPAALPEALREEVIGSFFVKEDTGEALDPAEVAEVYMEVPRASAPAKVWSTRWCRRRKVREEICVAPPVGLYPNGDTV